MDKSLSENFFNAIKEKNENLVKFLLEKGALITHTDWAGHTCLHLTAINGDVNIAKLLLDHGACINALSKFSKTCLHLACQNGFTSIAELLIKAGSRLDAQDMLKMTPLHWALENNHIDTAKLLLSQKKIDLNLLDKFNRDCMSIALKNKNDLIINMIKRKLDERYNLNETTLNEFINLEEKLGSSSLKTSLNEVCLNEKQNINSLNDFYKKKSFAKTLTSKSSSLFTHFPTETILTNKNTASSSLQSSQRFIKSNNQVKNSQAKNWKLILEEEDTSSSNEDEFFSLNDQKDEAAGCLSEDDMKYSNKKKRLSMSPLNKIEDTLYWLKQNHQSKKSFDDQNLEKKEFSLTDAGKLVLDYLNKNDPIREEKRLFMKMVKEMENDEKKELNQTNDENQDLDENAIFNLSSSLSNSEFDYL